MGCQKEIAKEIKEADAEYVLALKGNHSTLHAEVKTFLDDAAAEREAARPPQQPLSAGATSLTFHETVEKEHGRIEIRRFALSPHLDWLEPRAEWEGLKAVGRVEAVRTLGGKTTRERRYYLLSIDDVKAFGRASREHWGVENPLHWTLDVTFGEDRSRARTGHAAENLAALRRIALNLLQRHRTPKTSLRRQRLTASWNHAYLLELLRF